MLQGLLPNPQISVVGVSWTLAVIFVFYLLFPFFCFLLFSKKRVWLGFIIAGIYNILCQLYFFDEQHVLGNFMERENILYSAIFFMAGGLIYLYRDELERLKKEAALGREYRKELEGRFVKAAMLLELGLKEPVLREMAAALGAEQLKQAGLALEEKTARLFAPAPQLMMGKETALKTDSAFLI